MKLSLPRPSPNVLALTHIGCVESNMPGWITRFVFVIFLELKASPTSPNPSLSKQHQFDFYYQKGEYLQFRMHKFAFEQGWRPGVWCEI